MIPSPATRRPPGGVARLLDGAVGLGPIGEGGYSGARLERVVDARGRALVVKRISPRFDLTMRLTADTGRAARLWTSGVLDDLPREIDHAILAAEPDGAGGWTIVMRDVSGALLPRGRLLSRAENLRLFRAAAAMYGTFRGRRIEGLCALADRYTLLSPATAARECARSPIMAAAWRGWGVFGEVVPDDVATAVYRILERPGPFVARLEGSETTLVHGDFWLGNLGLAPRRVVMLDWGLAAAAPPAVDLATYLATSGHRVAATREQIIGDFRAALGGPHDRTALRLALLGGLVEMGWYKALKVADAPDEDRRARAAADLAWWVGEARRCLGGTWSPV